jgi:hypothetical protein
MLRIFSPEKIGRLRPGANPRSWVPEASMLATRPPKPLLVGVVPPEDGQVMPETCRGCEF